MPCRITTSISLSIKVISIIAFLLSFSGCEVDDQTLASKKQLALINPHPVARDFNTNNGKHEVLVAVLDSGLDYNHPALVNNIHFQMDQNSVVTGTGHDFVGNDSWPAPYLARTNDSSPITSAATKSRSKAIRSALDLIVFFNPSLNELFNPDRLIEVESQIGQHGTLVAGLISQQNDRIGILPYRISIANIESQANLAESAQTFVILDKLVGQIESATDMAASAGAKIINMSFVFNGIQTSSQNSAFEIWAKRIASVISKNQKIIFVAAAGNEGKEIAAGAQFPCGLSLPNLICVVATDASGKPLNLTNRPDSSLNQISAMGKDIYSTTPTLICNSEVITLLAENGLSLPESVLESVSNKLKKDCEGAPPYSVNSGTSLSAAIVSHELARIMLESKQELSPNAALDALKFRFPKGVRAIHATYDLDHKK